MGGKRNGSQTRGTYWGLGDGGKASNTIHFVFRQGSKFLTRRKKKESQKWESLNCNRQPLKEGEGVGFKKLWVK